MEMESAGLKEGGGLESICLGKKTPTSSLAPRQLRLARPEKQSRTDQRATERVGGVLWVPSCSQVANKPSGKPSREEMGRVGGWGGAFQEHNQGTS